MGRRWRYTGVGEEIPSESDRQATGQVPNAPEAGSAQGSTTRYEVGPGFEIAIRAALNHPVEVNLKNGGEGAKPPLRSGDQNHRHVTIEKRLDAIERALFIMVDQLKRIDDQLASGRPRS